MKTVRFADIVERCGKPETYALWTTPDHDPAFKRALKDHRVMTVHQENRTGKTDYGVVGFTEDSHAELLVFPKGLRRYEGKRVVGLRYDLLKGDPSASAAKGRRKEKPKTKTEKVSVFVEASPKAKPAPVKEKPAEPSPKETAPPQGTPSTPATLIRELRHVLSDLKKGKAVPAYQRLEKTIDRYAD